MNTTTPILHRLVLALTVTGALFGLVSGNALARDTDIYFTDPSDQRLNKPDSDILDRMVTIEGDYMPREKFIQVKNFQLAES